jgi:acetyl-CoA carboxylase biotin carboxyl carrier protein
MADRKTTEGEGPAATKIDVDMIRQLLELMSQHDLAELEIEQQDLAVRLRKGAPASPAAPVTPIMIPPVVALPMGATAPAAAAALAAEKLPAIKSPMVGTYYAASSPDAEPYVKEGDHVTEDSVVCIIEAMKVFNEIRAEMSGTIEKILVQNSQPVEFGQAMFVVRPD